MYACFKRDIEDGFVLFVLIEAEKPRLVIETGIAAGASSNLILNRLNAIESGELISVDITSKVGELVEEKLRDRWNIKVLPKLFKRKAFLHILNSNQNATIFLHDSDHSLQWQIFEISSAIKCLPSVKHILVDDVSEEFQSFVLNNLPEWDLVVIDEGRKFSGYLSRK
jgi:cephalosporin hydroxylase